MRHRVVYQISLITYIIILSFCEYIIFLSTSKIKNESFSNQKQQSYNRIFVVHWNVCYIRGRKGQNVYFYYRLLTGGLL